MTEEQKKEFCCRCINGDEKGNCIAKQEAPLDTFMCENGEQFELYEE